MTWFKSIPSRFAAVGVLSAALGFLVAWPVFATGQDKKDPVPDPVAKPAVPAGGPTETNKDLIEQIKQLNAKVVRLEAAPKQDLKATPSGAPVKGGPADKPDKVEGVPPGKRIPAKYQNCAECHQKRPTGPLPPSHLEPAEGSDKGAKQDDTTGTAGNKTPAAKTAVPAAKTVDANKELADQIRQLHTKVARLEAALKQDLKATPSGASDKGGPADKPGKAEGVPPGKRIAAKYQNCIQCHQKRPSGPLPPSHLEPAQGSDKGAKQDDTTGTGKSAVPDPGDGKMKGMGMKGKGMGMGMKGKGMGMGMKGKGMGMDMMDEKKGMAGMGGGKTGMGGMSGGMADMEMMEMMGMMGMAPKSAGGMAGMKSVGKMQMQAALPGFPGASHIYHIGATDFFLNHPEHITLTPKQEIDLFRLKEKAVLTKTSAQRKIDEAEQELWILTSADEPDAVKVEAKIQEIEKLRGAQRMALIRAVGDAAKLLTDEQRKVLIGQGQPTAPAPRMAPDPHATHPKTP